MRRQEMSLDAPPRGRLPEWGRRVRFDKFSLELVPAGERSLNVRLPKTLATISFSTDEGSSSLAGDRLRRYERRPYEYIVVPANFPLRGESKAAPEVLSFAFSFDELKPDIAAATQIPLDLLEPRVIIGGPKPFTTEVAQRIRRHLLSETVSRDYLHALSFVLIVDFRGKHFHERLVSEHKFELDYTWTKRVLQTAGLVSRAPGARRTGRSARDGRCRGCCCSGRLAGSLA